MTPGTFNDSPRDDLAGLRVAITRSPDRAGAVAAAVAAAGADPVLVPLIDFEVSEHKGLDEALRRLAAGEYRWLVVSSITTVRALKQWCAQAGTSLAELVPAQTRVATIGPTSVAVLAAEGIHASLAPEDIQSAAGLVALWPSYNEDDGGNRRVLLPQSNLAAATLENGIAAAGWSAETVTAYETVDFPADNGRRLAAGLNHAALNHRVLNNAVLNNAASSFSQLTPAQAVGEIRAGELHAVVLASGSAARRVAETMAPLPESCLLIAIGQPTRVEAERVGLRIAATAQHPTPEGIVDALIAARKYFPPAASQETP